MKNNYKFFKNTDCEYYPCHTNIEELNCLFCFCPLYPFKDCGGNCEYTKKGLKLCTHCTVPHIPENYEHIMSLLKEKYKDIF